MIWTFAVTVDRVICGPRAELWHVTVRLQIYAFRKPQSFPPKYSWNMRLQRAILCRVCRPPFESSRSIVCPMSLGRTRCTSSIGTLYIYLRQRQHGHPGPELRDHAYRVERVAWSLLLCSMNTAACHNGTAQVELRLVTDTDNVIQRIERFAARHQGFARGQRRLDQRSRHIWNFYPTLQGQSIRQTT
jgi:hypothetical protein